MGDLVVETFGDDIEAAKEYRDAVRVSQRDLAKTMGRVALLLIGAMILFILLVSQSTGAAVKAGDASSVRISAGPFAFSDASVLYRVLPGAVALLVYSLAILGEKYDRMDSVIDALVIRYETRIAQNHLSYLLEPTVVPLYTLGSETVTEDYTRADQLSDVGSAALTLGVVVVPAAFFVYAFAQLFDREGLGDPLVWTVLAFSILMGISSVAEYVTSQRRRVVIAYPSTPVPSRSTEPRE